MAQKTPPRIDLHFPRAPIGSGPLFSLAVSILLLAANDGRAQTSDHSRGGMHTMASPGMSTAPAVPRAVSGARRMPAVPPRVVAQPVEGGDMHGMHERGKPGAPEAHGAQSVRGVPHVGHGSHAAMPDTGVLGPYPMSREASGTSWQPDAAEHRGLHTMAGDWTLMGHANLTAIYDRQSGPRGGDKTFLTGMLMGAARHQAGSGGTLNVRAMLSPEPFMGRRGYPLLVANGETADGTTPLIDRQHPHEIVMELSGSYSHAFGRASSAFLYAGYPGEAALGPPAFMHRASGEDIPQAPITHHWLDSTHIVFGVVTGGIVSGDWKIEMSRFTGREPDQRRFDFDRANADSTSARISWNPGAHWALQVSWGELESPEQLVPGSDETRWTASSSYAAPVFEDSSLAATLALGVKHLSNGTELGAALIEAAYKVGDSWTFYSRGEVAQNWELVPALGKKRVGEITAGGCYEWRLSARTKLGLGALTTRDFLPSSLRPVYGRSPHGEMVYLRLTAK
jgi:hypothetical protein